MFIGMIVVIYFESLDNIKENVNFNKNVSYCFFLNRAILKPRRSPLGLIFEYLFIHNYKVKRLSWDRVREIFITSFEKKFLFLILSVLFREPLKSNEKDGERYPPKKEIIIIIHDFSYILIRQSPPFFLLFFIKNSVVRCNLFHCFSKVL